MHCRNYSCYQKCRGELVEPWHFLLCHPERSRRVLILSYPKDIFSHVCKIHPSLGK